jgi:phage tail-like protein
LTLSTITLGRSVTDNHELWAWRDQIAQAKRGRMSPVVLMNDEGNEKLRWNLRNCWPTKWTGPSFDATSNEVAT